MNRDISRKSYLDTLNNRQRKIEERIKKLDIRIARAKGLTRGYEIERQKLKKQMNLLAREKIEYNRTNINKYHDSHIIHGLDKVYDHQDSKVRELSVQIEDLEKLRNQMKEAGEKRRVSRKISKKRAKLARLKKREARVSKMQRAIIMTKRAVHRKKYKLAKQEGKVDYYENKVAYMQGLRKNLTYSNTITGKAKGKILDKVYQFKENRYRKKQKKHEEIVREMKGKRFVGVVSANVIVMVKRAVNRFREEPIREHTTTRTSDDELNQMFENQNNQNSRSNQNSSQNVR